MAYSESDIRTDILATPEILEKVRSRSVYAQHLYAAFCNMRWQKTEIWPILKDEYFSMSWRGAGKFVAEIRGQGDYLDFYCSGLARDYDEKIPENFVSEGTVTPEVQADLRRLGWHPVPWSSEN